MLKNVQLSTWEVQGNYELMLPDIYPIFQVLRDNFQTI